MSQSSEANTSTGRLNANKIFDDEDRGSFKDLDFCSIHLLQMIGKGSYGEVWKGKFENTLVAVKVINSSNLVLKGIFFNEINVLKDLVHPNIVKVLGGCTTPVFAIVMEYLTSGSLHELLHKKKHVDYEADHAISWAVQCSCALSYMHALDIIHRDLKPANLLLKQSYQVLKIADFGTACYMFSKAPFLRGSAHWMAPEVFEKENVSEKSDVYSFGIILWEMLTRQQPYGFFENHEEILWNVTQGMRPQSIESCPKFLTNIMTACWEKSPEKRPGMHNVMKALEHIQKFFPDGNQPLSVNEKSGESHCKATKLRQDKLSDVNCSSSSATDIKTVNGVNTDELQKMLLEK